MMHVTTTRRFKKGALLSALLGVLAVSTASASFPRMRPQHATAPREQAPQRAPVSRPAEQRPQMQRPAANRPGQPNSAHLSQWMESHRNMSLAEQQRALAAEPGFQQYRPEVQQRMHDQLTQLNNMSPEQRQRTIARTEWMESLPQERRLQVHSALSNLGALPEDRRKYVGKMFRSLRDLPEAQRNAYLNAPPVRAQLSDHERGVLNDLFAAQPYLPPATSGPQAPR